MIRSNLFPTLTALKAEYEGRKMEAGELCDEFNLLAKTFRSCFGEAEEDTIKERLLRHYVSEGLLSAPAKEGQQNVFGFQHLMELLAVRKLQSERALTLIGMQNLAAGKDTEYLYHILTRGARLDVSPADEPEAKPGAKGNAEALSAIREIERATRRRQRPETRPETRPAEHLPGLLADDSLQWKAHHLLAPGLELVISDDFQIPIKREEERQLLDDFRACLREQRLRRPKS
jgi:DNA-binding transcriptional MerR regulator